MNKTFLSFVASSIVVSVFLIAGLIGMMIVVIFMAAYSEIGNFAQNIRDGYLLLVAGFCVGIVIKYFLLQRGSIEVKMSLHDKLFINVLSNVYDCPFYFDRVYCASRESLLQSFKTNLVNVQIRLCSLSGHEAQKAGQEYNNWKDVQFLYWRGKSYERGSQEYRNLLIRVFDIENMSVDVITALLATGNRKLTHATGKIDEAQTTLTEVEFCKLMVIARAQLVEKGLVYMN